MKKFFIIGLSLLFLLSISAVFASDNETVLDDSSDDKYDSEFAVSDFKAKYSPYNEFNVMLFEKYSGDEIYGEDVNIIWDDGVEESLYEWDDSYGYNTYIDRGVGNYTLKVFLKGSDFSAKPVNVSVNIIKGNVKLTPCKWYSTSDQYTTLKVNVIDQNNDIVDEGTVKFTVNGKSYNVKVKDGVAVKKIKLSKAKTYTYYATFFGENYNNKSSSSKVYVFSTSKNTRTFYIKGYKIILPLSKFKKLVNAKNTNKRVDFEIKTKKLFKQKVYSYKTVYKWKYVGKTSLENAHAHGWKAKNIVKHWISDGEYYYTCSAYKKVSVTKLIYKTVKAKVSIVISYGGKNGGQTAPPNKYLMYLNTPYQNPGYEKCSPWLSGSKTSSELNKLNKAKVKI